MLFWNSREYVRAEGARQKPLQSGWKRKEREGAKLEAGTEVSTGP